MAERSGFFNAQETSAGVYDRIYNAEDFSNIFNLMTPNGIMITNEEAQQETIDKTTVSGLKVLKGSDDSKLIISPGFAMINGHWYHNDEEKEKSVDGLLGGESTYNINVFILYEEGARSVTCNALGDTAYNSLEEENKILLATYNYMTKELEDKREKFVIPWINSFYTVFNNAINTLTNRMDSLFPVGAIYTTINKNNPGNFLPGTWQQFGQGRVLVGQNDSIADFMHAQATGGSKTVTLNVNQIPSHSHSSSGGTCTTGNNGNHTHTVKALSLADNLQFQLGSNVKGYLPVQAAGNITSSTAGNHNHSVPAHSHTIGNTGSGQAHENMPPYIVVYFWERVE